MKILLRISYVGTDFSGFQVQPDSRTVQGVLCEAASALFGIPCDVTGCSRTDAGVHAREFVCAVTPHSTGSFDRSPIPEGKIHRAFAHLLPHDLTVTGAAFADDAFHPRYGVRSKQYVYRILNSRTADPFLADRALHIPSPIDEDALRKMTVCAAEFVGTHDFRAFMASGSDITDTTRTVYSSAVERIGDMITFTVSADGFLYNMVRIMTGTLIDASRGKIDIADIRTALCDGERSHLGFTAPACGLYLDRVDYPAPIIWKAD